MVFQKMRENINKEEELVFKDLSTQMCSFSEIAKKGFLNLFLL